MKQRWTEEELMAHFLLSPDELALLDKKSGTGQLGYAVLLTYLRYEGCFPSSLTDVPKAVVACITKQLGLSAQELNTFY